jgi:transcriptional regulator GlxA family with amidase domain
MPQITLLTFDNCLASGVTGLMDVFNIANQLWQLTQEVETPLFSWRLVSASGEAVQSSVRLPFAVDGRLSAGDEADVILIPAVHYQSDEQLLAQIKAVSHSCGNWLWEQHRRQALVAACCTSTFVLAETDLLNQRQATTSWWLGRLFQEHYPKVDLCLEALITEDGGLLCAGAIAAHLDMGLRLVERFAGQYLALLCAKTMLIDANRTTQTPYMILQTQLNHRDDLVFQVQVYMQENLQEPLNIQDIAGEFKVSQRTMVRHFRRATDETPIVYLQKLRIETAKRLLETTAYSFEDIVGQVGYMDASTFRRLFIRHVQLSPGEYRRRFSIGQ